MTDASNVLFMRGGCENRNYDENGYPIDDNIWDDEILIKAYDKAVNLAKDEVAKRVGLGVEHSECKHKAQSSKQSQLTNKSIKKWTLGSPCRAVYSEDGKVYEAVVTKIYESSGMCTVRFIGYGNIEKIELSTLLESEGLQSQIAQEKDALDEKCNQEASDSSYSLHSNMKEVNGIFREKMDCDMEDTESCKVSFPSGSFCTSIHDTMPPAPPLPPQLMAKLPENDADALSSMLMSWYISGFHTGYYHGLKRAKDVEGKKKHC